MMTQDGRPPAINDVTRRDVLKFAGIVILGSAAGELAPTMGAQARTSTSNSGCSGGDAREEFPTSPLVLTPFVDVLPIPLPLAPIPKSVVDAWPLPPGSGPGQQDSYGSTHQVWPSQYPLVYQLKLQIAAHSFTTSRVQPIDSFGRNIVPPDGIRGPRVLPASTIYGFNGRFPGPMIYARYGQPVIVRFENHLHQNPLNLDVQDFGAPDRAFLTHLHNGHTAPESDGNPAFRMAGYQPGQYVDNLYLNAPAGGDEREKQSFFWYHDHRMDHTSANVYKGMAGIYPIYDPVADNGDERFGLRLPGVPNAATGRVDYDIPLVLADFRLDDGRTKHQDFHTGCGETHREWWGKTFFMHFPNKGFVGDLFTVNGTAYPVLQVKRRKYRFRFLDASVSRIYELKLLSSTSGPVAAPGKQGQYELRDGQQSMRFLQIGTDGGLLPYPILRDSFQLWPAKRREVIIDFTRYLDGTPTTKGDVVYLANTLKMTSGREPDAIDPLDPNYPVPILKFVIGDSAPDNSVIPTRLRELPVLDMREVNRLPRRTFEFERDDTFGGEIQWTVNGLPFDPLTPIAYPRRGKPEVWTFRNNGGGWVHPVHLHMEEHRILRRESRSVVAPPVPPAIARGANADDASREDVVSLRGGEEVTIYRNFRTFTGPYVVHCHNLAHEDHAMMFGWTILP